MLVYSKKIIRFINDIKITVKNILAKEVGVRVCNSRFFDKQEYYSYPIKIVIYNDQSKLGYFDAGTYELGFHERLMDCKTTQLHNIIRHEIAHYMTFINHGPTDTPHGKEFKSFCESLNWHKDVFSATVCLEIDNDIPKESAILRKIQKLMALSTSSNCHESEQAMIKSQTLLLKYNLDESCIKDENDEKIFLKRILKQKKKDAKMQAIAHILETFFVNTIYSKQTGSICLEIVGSKVNVEIADYVANFLTVELDRLWLSAKKQYATLSGITAKNSFFLGIAKGYCNKIKFLKQSYESDFLNGLMVIEKKLDQAKEMVYPRLSTFKSSGGYSPEASSLGQKMGNALSIHLGVSASAKYSNLEIGHR